MKKQNKSGRFQHLQATTTIIRNTVTLHYIEFRRTAIKYPIYSNARVSKYADVQEHGYSRTILITRTVTPFRMKTRVPASFVTHA